MSVSIAVTPIIKIKQNKNRCAMVYKGAPFIMNQQYVFVLQTATGSSRYSRGGSNPDGRVNLICQTKGTAKRVGQKLFGDLEPLAWKWKKGTDKTVLNGRDTNKNIIFTVTKIALVQKISQVSGNTYSASFTPLADAEVTTAPTADGAATTQA